MDTNTDWSNFNATLKAKQVIKKLFEHQVQNMKQMQNHLDKIWKIKWWNSNIHVSLVRCWTSSQETIFFLQMPKHNTRFSADKA